METKVSDEIWCPCGGLSSFKGDFPAGYGVQGNLFICPVCQSVSYINAGRLIGNSVIKYYPMTETLSEFEKLCCDYLLKRGNLKFFNTIKSVNVSKFYLPMREYGFGDGRKLISMGDNKYTKGIINNQQMGASFYDPIFPVEDFSNLTFQALNSKSKSVKKDELKPMQFSDKYIQTQYKIDPQELYIIKYLPIMSFEFEYDGKRYYIKKWGTNKHQLLYTNFVAEESVLEPKEYFKQLQSRKSSTLSIGLVLFSILIFVFYLKGYWISDDPLTWLFYSAISLFVGLVVGKLQKYFASYLRWPIDYCKYLLYRSNYNKKRMKFGKIWSKFNG